jgi:serine/threonine-protein kinase
MDAEAQGPTALVGEQVAGYHLERLLGQGATGAVFLGQRLATTPTVLERAGVQPILLPDQAAVKLLLLPWSFSPSERAEFRARFTREAQTLERLHHPHILALLAFGEEEGARELPYLLLPYLGGGTLAQWLRAQTAPVPLAEVSGLLNQLADALDYAHGQGVVHRDLKPSNILRDGGGQLVLADFGIVRLLGEAPMSLTAAGFVLGTPAYMAPEQFSGAGVGPAADRYSLGMVLYELVTGRVAFQAPTLAELVRRLLHEPPPLPRAGRPELPVPAEAVLLRALAKEPGERFATARELAEAFALGVREQWAPGLTRYAYAVGTAGAMPSGPALAGAQVAAANAVTAGPISSAPPVGSSQARPPMPPYLPLAAPTPYTPPPYTPPPYPPPPYSPPPYPQTPYPPAQGMPPPYGAPQYAPPYVPPQSWPLPPPGGGSPPRSGGGGVVLGAVGVLLLALAVVLGPLGGWNWLQSKLMPAPTPTSTTTSTPPPGAPYDVDDASSQITYSGPWQFNSGNAGFYDGTQHYTGPTWHAHQGDYAQLTFTGTQIAYYAIVDTHHGNMDVQIDGSYQATVDLYRPERQGDVLVWTSPLLPRGSHTIRLIYDDTKNPASTDTVVTLDAFRIVP